MPVAVDVVCGALGIVVFAVVVYAGFDGTQAATSNLEPTVIYVLFWVGLPVLSVFLGDVFRLFNPWRALARGVAWMAKEISGDLPEPLAYPERLGRWPAAAGILIFAWVELAYSNRDAPQTLAIMALAYAGFQLLGHGPLRHRALVQSRRRVRCLLRPLRAALGVHAQGQGDPRCGARSAARPRSTWCRARWRCCSSWWARRHSTASRWARSGRAGRRTSSSGSSTWASTSTTRWRRRSRSG